MTDSASVPWICPSCGHRDDDARFCPSRGERSLTAHDRTLIGLLEQWFESVFHIDGRLVRTGRSLLASPGTLTAAYVDGQRKRFIGPFQLFLVANVLFSSSRPSRA